MPLGKKKTTFTTKIHGAATADGKPADGGKMVVEVTFSKREASREGGVENRLLVNGRIVAFCDKNGDTEHVVAAKDGVLEDGVLRLVVRDGDDDHRTVDFRIGGDVRAVFKTFKTMAPPPFPRGKLVVMTVQPCLERYGKDGTRRDGSTYSEGDVVITKTGPKLTTLCSQPEELKVVPDTRIGAVQFKRGFGLADAAYHGSVRFWPGGKVRPWHMCLPPGDALVVAHDADGALAEASWTANVDVGDRLTATVADKTTGAETAIPVLPVDITRAVVQRGEDGELHKRLAIFTSSAFCDSAFGLTGELWGVFAPALIEAFDGYIHIQYPNVNEKTTRGVHAERQYVSFEPELPEGLDPALVPEGEWGRDGIVAKTSLHPDIGATVTAAGVEISYEVKESLAERVVHVPERWNFAPPYEPQNRAVVWLNSVAPDDYYLYPAKIWRFFAIFADGSRPGPDEIGAVLDARGDRIDDVLFAAVRRNHLDEPAGPSKRAAEEPTAAPAKKKKKTKK